jgi:hypothetical protein
MATAKWLSMKSALKKWITKASLSHSSESSQKGLAGGIDLVTPSMINGWVWHPQYSLYDVRLLAADKLLAATKVDVHRSDVEEKVGAKGDFGFSLKLPVNADVGGLSGDLQLLALTSDGSLRFPLSCMKDKGSTQSALKTALDPMYLGMQGNFDGPTADGGLTVTGWCFQSLKPSKVCTVFLQVGGMAPTPLTCNQQRPGFAQLGFPEHCGFSFRLHELMGSGDFTGKRLRVTFDQSGLLELPEASQSFVPGPSVLGQLPAVKPSSLSVSSQRTSETLEVHTPTMHARLPDFAKYRSELEEFKQLCDVFEREITTRIQQETISKNKSGRLLPKWIRVFGNNQ